MLASPLVDVYIFSLIQRYRTLITLLAIFWSEESGLEKMVDEVLTSLTGWVTTTPSLLAAFFLHVFYVSSSSNILEHFLLW